MSVLNPLTAIKLILSDLRYAIVAAIAAFIIYIIFSVIAMVLMIFIITIVLLPFVMLPVYYAGMYILARFYQHAAGMEPPGTPA